MAATTDPLTEVEAEIARLKIIRDWLKERSNGATAAPVRRRQPRTRQAGRVTAAVAAETVLAKAARPMRVKELLPLVQAEGASIKDGEGLAKTLGRSPRFVKAGRGLWTLAS